MPLLVWVGVKTVIFGLKNGLEENVGEREFFDIAEASPKLCIPFWSQNGLNFATVIYLGDWSVPFLKTDVRKTFVALQEFSPSPK